MMKAPSDQASFSSMDRRRFLRLGTATAMWGVAHAAGTGARANAVAQDAASLYRRVIPGRKDLPVGWVRSLALRDAPEDAAIRCADKAHLPHIGMTVGGIAAGTLYLTGDGRLAVWDLFNQPHEGVVPNRAEVPAGMDNLGGAGPVVRERDGANYVRPPTPESHPQAFRHGFELEIDGSTRPLDASGWEAVSFRGDWPVGRVEYADPACPLVVRLHAWSPFIPLELDDSTLPVTVMEFTVENSGGESVGCCMRGVLENPVLHHSARERGVPPVSSGILRDSAAVLLVHGPAAADEAAVSRETPRPELLFDDFERASHAPWVVEGQAFGPGPIEAADVPGYQGDLGLHGRRALQSHAAAPGDSIAEKDAAIGSLTSPEFTIERDYITCLLGGGKHPGQTGIELLVEGEVVASLSGRDENRMRPAPGISRTSHRCPASAAAARTTPPASPMPPPWPATPSPVSTRCAGAPSPGLKPGTIPPCRAG
jgi:non-lysosomal glucosylceramidase